jgi:LPS export ABC transporter protein LptC
MENYDKIMTQRSDSLTIVSSENGKRQYNFSAPLMENYGMAREPYTEFSKGVTVRSFNDSTDVAASTLVADYAIFYEKQQLWEAKGNVVAVSKEGQKLESQQLFWNQKSKRIYSNVDTRVTQPNGEVITGVGFESDESMNDWVFRRPKGKVLIDTDPNERPDTASVAVETQRAEGPAVVPTLATPAVSGASAEPPKVGGFIPSGYGQDGRATKAGGAGTNKPVPASRFGRSTVRPAQVPPANGKQANKTPAKLTEKKKQPALTPKE